MADDVGVLGTGGSIKGDSDGALDDGGQADISKGDTLSDKESAGGEVGLKGLEGTGLALDKSGVNLSTTVNSCACCSCAGTYGLGVGGEDALHKLEDEVRVGTDLVVGERDPLVNESRLLEVGAQQRRVGGKRSD